MILRLFICLMVLGWAAQPAAATPDRTVADGAGIIEAAVPSDAGPSLSSGSGTRHCGHSCPGCGHGPSCPGQSGCHAPTAILIAPFRLSFSVLGNERPFSHWILPSPLASPPPGKPPRTLA